MSVSDNTETKLLALEKIDESRIIILSKKNIISQNDNKTDYDVQRMICLISETNDKKYHKYCGFNKFTDEIYDLPSTEDGWKIKKNEYILRGSFNKNLSLFTEDKQINFSAYDGWNFYQTLDNYGTGFLVFIDELEQNVHIYGRTHDVIPYDYQCDEFAIFNNLIGTYNPISIFIGKSSLNDMTNFSGGHGDKYDGNSILLRIGDKTEFRYLFIGSDIYEFTTDEIITKYVSSVGNNQVPYPYAESENWCYCMSGCGKSLTANHPEREKSGHISYFDVEYIKMDINEIAPRDSDNCIYEYSDAEICSFTTFNKGVEIKHVENSCSLYD